MKPALTKKLVCLNINDKVIARQGHKVYATDSPEIGIVCSGSQGITVGCPIATAYVDPAFSALGQTLYINIRDKLVPATIVKRPFYKRT